MKEDVLKKMKERFNGCPLFEGRTKEKMDVLTGKEVTIQEFFPMADYHAVVFAEYPDKVFLSGGALKQLLNEFGEDAVGLKIAVLEMIKTADKHDFRPINVIGY